MVLHSFKLLIFAGIGAVLGAAYLRALAWNVGLYCGCSSVRFALAIHFLRMLGGAVIFIAIARMGAAPLASTFIGFQLSRVCGVAAKILPV